MSQLADMLDDKLRLEPATGEELIKAKKQEVRLDTWSVMQNSQCLHDYPPQCVDKIPYFLGSELAADRLTPLKEYQDAGVVKVNPSLAQMGLRRRILQDGKTLIVPAPALSPNHPNGGGQFMFKLEGIAKSKTEKACTKKGAARFGTPLGVETGWDGVETIDLYVVGSVAVTPEGVRLGKGLGYAEMEWAILYKMGKVSPEHTVVATTVDDLQVVEPERMPAGELMTPHDLPVDLIVTPSRVIQVKQRLDKPTVGIIWEKVHSKTFDEVPVLQDFKNSVFDLLP